MAMYRKVAGGFRSDWGADLCAVVKSIIGTAACGPGSGSAGTPAPFDLLAPWSTRIGNAGGPWSTSLRQGP